MIVSAQLRATIQQLEKYNSAVNTFRGKYAGLPGDLSNASSFWSTAENGDGDGQVESATGGAITTNAYEIINFWEHLTQAGMADGSYVAPAAGAATACALGTCYPRTKFERGGVGVYHVSGINYWRLGRADAAEAATIAYSNVLSPPDAWGIDKKIDDSVPSSGNVVARTNANLMGEIAATDNTVFTQADGASDCGATASTYNLDVTTTNCQLRIKMNY